MKTAAVAVLLFVTAASAGAQQREHIGNRPPAPTRPSRPVTPPTTPAQPPTTVFTGRPNPQPVQPTPFDARPGTYAPHYSDPVQRGNRSGYGSPFYSGAIGIGDYVPAPVGDAAPPDRRADAPRPAELPAQQMPEPPRVAAAHGPDTFYVIPGCYAGNRPPNPSRLPKGCDASRLQTVAIR